MTTDAHEEKSMNFVYQIIALGMQIYPTPIPTFIPGSHPESVCSVAAGSDDPR
jgi:hypothetical protein